MFLSLSMQILIILDLCPLLQAMLFAVSLVLQLATKILNIHVEASTSGTCRMKCYLAVTIATLQMQKLQLLNYQ
jgi:hypothetical protein